MMFGSIPKTFQGFASTLFQLYVLIISIIAGFSEYYTNPIASFGQRLVNPVRAVAANFSRNLTTVNIVSVVILIIVHSIITLILSQLAGPLPPNPVKVAVLESFHLILNLTTFFVYVILFNALLSWVSPDPLNPVVQLLALLSAPIVEPIRRVVPPLGGAIDLSPMIAIFALYIARGVGLHILSIFA
jgi:YggT family protein